MKHLKRLLIKFTSRKFLLLTAFFIMAQHLKHDNKISDTAWLAASIIGTFGWAALELYFRYKCGCKPDGGDK
jgi:hypothetical protein